MDYSRVDVDILSIEFIEGADDKQKKRFYLSLTYCKSRVHLSMGVTQESHIP